jgi:DNA primase
VDFQTFRQELLSRADIVDVVERYVPLKRAGATYKACCPFHSEKSPSFTVSPSRQTFHCFGCQAHGNAIDFIIQYSGLEFMDAVEELARSLGMEVPRFQVSRDAAPRRDKTPLTEVMGRAARFYKDQLKASPKAIDYLKGRGLTGEIAARFGLGYAPDDWQGLQSVFPDYNDAALVECGLVIVNEQGRRYDRFRDRIMFPILDQRGNVIGFGGRVLGAGEPKYLNSPETPLFEKGRELYGLTQARQPIRAADQVIVVEGYMDVVALAQMGIGNAVATLGTATTPNHLQKLLRHAASVVFCFDGDAAGRKAAWRALEASLDQLSDDRSAGFLFLPVEHDPDSFVREQGADAFRRVAANPTTLSEFLLRELKAAADLSHPEGRARLVHEAKPLLQKLAAPVLRVQLTKAIAEAAAMTQAEIEAQCGLKPLARGPAVTARPRSRVAPRSLEHALLEAVLHRPERAARIPLERIAADRPEGALIKAIAASFEQGELPAGGSGVLLEYFRGSPHEVTLQQMVAAMSVEAESESEEAMKEREAELETVFCDAIERLHEKNLAREIESLNEQARKGLLDAGGRRRLAELLSHKAQSHKVMQPND